MKDTSSWLQTFKSELGQTKAKTFAITGGKGGVGKTTFSLKVSMELAKQGLRVLLIDCDYNLSNTAIKLGLPPVNYLNELVSGKRAFQDCLYKDGGFNLLSANNGDLNFFESTFKTAQVVLDIIRAHSADYDYIFLDCPAGLNYDSLYLSAYVDQRVFVVIPDRSSITDSYSLIKILNKKFGVKENMLLVNQVANPGQFKKVVSTISETAENFLGIRTQVLGQLPKIKVAMDKFDQEMFSYKNSSASEMMTQIITNIVETDVMHHAATNLPAMNASLANEQEFTTQS